MLSHLDRKLWRDLRKMKGQAVAVALVMACGLAMMIMARSLIHSLETTRLEYYQANRFAEVFAHLKRAPNSLAARVAEIPGVATVQPGISVQVTLDMPGLDEPASGMVRSLPDFGEPGVEPALFCARANGCRAGSRGQVLVGEAFAEANQLKPGDKIGFAAQRPRGNSSRSPGSCSRRSSFLNPGPGARCRTTAPTASFGCRTRSWPSAFDLDGAFNYSDPHAGSRACQSGPFIAALDQTSNAVWRPRRVRPGRSSLPHPGVGRNPHPAHACPLAFRWSF